MITGLNPGHRPTGIGLGCVTFGREIDERAAFDIMNHAWARGVRHFDTAANYAGGASEAIIGAWRTAHRAEAATVTIATKVFPPYSPASIEAAVETSSRRLGMARIDLLYLHRWEPEAEAMPVLSCLDQLKRSGRVAHLGASNFTAAQLQRTLHRQTERDWSRVEVAQNNNNFAVREVDDRFAAVCAANGITIVSYSPLGAGFLTGKHTAGVVCGSRFEAIPGHQAIYFQPQARARLSQLQHLATTTGYSPTQLALAWALCQPAVSLVLIGARTPAHVDQAFEARSEATGALRQLTPS